jgi:ABC-2 type transport system ATP-binding protein
MTMPAFQLDHLTRQYRNKVALHRLTLSQEAGHILGIVGLAGSAKTTLMRLLAGLDKPTSGLISVLGGGPQRANIRTQIGTAIKPQLLDPMLTCEATLVQFSRLRGFPLKASHQISEQLLDELNLLAHAGILIRDLPDSSHHLLCAGVSLVGTPTLLLLDDALDDLGDIDFSVLASILRNRASQGSTVVIASRYATGLNGLCDNIALLHKGTLIGKSTPEVICSSLRGLLFKYRLEGDQTQNLGWEDCDVRFTGTCTEVLAEREIVEQMAVTQGSGEITEIEPSLEEACLWILRNPEAIAARSKLWDHQGETTAATG